MTPIQKMMEAGKHVDKVLAVSDKLSDELVDAIMTISEYDIDEIMKIADAVKTIDRNSKNIMTVENGIHYIKSVLEIQNHITYVSDIRDSIGLVAGNIDTIRKVSEEIDSMRPILAMRPMIDETLSMSVKMDKVLDMEGDISGSIEAVGRIESIIREVHEEKLKMYNIHDATAKKRNEVSDMLEEIKEIKDDINSKIDALENLSINVKHLSHEEDGYSFYDRECNTLEIGIPSGKPGPRGKYKGDKGEPGRDGKDFSPSYLGKLQERARYDNYPAGISFLSLDEIPTMIYFKKSNARGDWTEGQPFGVSNGGYVDESRGIDIVDGINVGELTRHVIARIKQEQGR